MTQSDGIILIVDDSKLNLILLEKILKDNCYRVITAETAKEALFELSQSAVDLILLDINLPDVDGLDFCRHLKSQTTWGAIPVIFISALDSSEDKVRGFEAGGVDYVTKPFYKQEVVARVKTQMTIQALRHELEARISELESLYLEVKEASIRDPLTGLYNRRYLEEVYHSLIHQADRYQLPLTLMMCDLDHFKDVNDRFGHQVGDDVLLRFSKFLQGAVRSSDTPARFGGEEFLVILPGTDHQNASIVAERLRRMTEEGPWSDINRDLKVTVSIGLASYDPSKGGIADTGKALLSLADQNLYAAKNSGRNRVC